MADHTFPLIEVSGDSYQMGYQHGAQTTDLIRKYMLWIERLTGMSKNILCQNAMAFLPIISDLSLAFVEEVRGLAEGARISFEEAMLCTGSR